MIDKKIIEKYKNFPKLIFIETTNKCNAKCPMCPRGLGMMKRPVGTMDMNLFKKIIDECGEHKEVNKILLYGDGEPLLDEYLVERIKYIKKVCSRLFVRISTNISLLTKERGRELLLARLDGIVLSLDGTNKETYNKMRGLDYDRAVKNIRDLIDTKKELNSSTQLIVRMIRTKLTCSELDEFKRIWKDKGVDVEIKPAHNFLDTSLHLASGFTDTLVPCEKLWVAMMIDWNGNVPICCRDYQEEQLLGNAGNQSLESIWQGENLNKLREIHLSRERLKDLKPCNRCSEIKKNVS